MSIRTIQIPISKIAEITGAKLTGDPSLSISGLAKIEEANAGDLTFLYMATYEKYFPETKASAIFVRPGFDKSRDDICYLEVDNPNKAFFIILTAFFAPKLELSSIARSASIDATAVIGEGSAIGENVVISKNCRIGKNTRIFHNTVLLENVSVGDNCLIYPNVSIREDCIIGNNVILQPGVVIGSDGFGFFPDAQKHYIKIPQIGNVIVEDDVEVGANAAIDRAALGSTVIKRGTKLDNLVQIAHNVVVGEDTVISALTGIAGSSKIGSRCIFAGQVGVTGHITVADDVIIGAQSGVSKTIDKPGAYLGSPTKDQRTALRQEGHLRSLPDYVERIKALEIKIKELEIKLGTQSSGKA